MGNSYPYQIQLRGYHLGIKIQVYKEFMLT